MSVLSSILQHAQAAQAAKSEAALPQASTTSSAGGSSGSSSSANSASSTISANDFLTLLVTEMQNQDPTAATDPNAYINQLVSVNSLEQLIDINQTLSTDLTSPTSSSSSTGSSAKPGLTKADTSVHAAKTLQPVTGSNLSTLTSALSPSARASKTSITQHAAGNLTIPDASPAALRVAHALSGQSRSLSGQLPSSQGSSTPSYSAR
jgi:flagellar basal-body rod modification protein FlgD